MKELLIGVSAVVGIGLLTWGGIYVNGFFNAEREAQRTKVFQESQAYNDGMRLQLNNQCIEYDKADAAGRVGIKNMVQDTFASLDTSDYPAHLQQCLRNMGVR
jgi:hypothetical protein